ncbi:uncharacterized protein [Rutidosis leptorrhynchoides]|uniref:uncharacterized protein n=1 Tax=Rutidosis leptorrhynchoides TaxID=125765 RepID=UPI003A98F0CF
MEAGAVSSPTLFSRKNKQGFLSGSYKHEDCSDVQKELWDRSNALVLSWLLSTQTQGNSSITTYFNCLRSLWAELDSIKPLPIIDAEQAALLHAHYDEINLHQFLMGLNESYIAVRGQILLMNPVPALRNVYNMLIQDESQRSYSPSNNGLSHIVSDPTAMYSSAGSHASASKPRFAGTCDHCGIRGHKKSDCYKLVGFPPNFKFIKSKARAHNAVSDSPDPVADSRGSNTFVHTTADPFSFTPPPIFTPAQYSRLLSLIEQPTGSPAANSASLNAASTSSAPQEGNFQSWIIDSGATNHMVYNSNGLHNIQHAMTSQAVHLPNGNHASISHSGSLDILSDIQLKNILFVPSFHHNLLSVHKLAKESQCFLSFYPDFCLLQDIRTGMVKGIGREYKGLYYLKTQTQSSNVFSAAAASNPSDFATWHHRLGHLNSIFLSKLLVLNNIASNKIDVSSC